MQYGQRGCQELERGAGPARVGHGGRTPPSHPTCVCCTYHDEARGLGAAEGAWPPRQPASPRGDHRPPRPDSQRTPPRLLQAKLGLGGGAVGGAAGAGPEGQRGRSLRRDVPRRAGRSPRIPGMCLGSARPRCQRRPGTFAPSVRTRAAAARAHVTQPPRGRYWRRPAGKAGLGVRELPSGGLCGKRASDMEDTGRGLGTDDFFLSL